jgi:hypothetical protein
MAKKQTETALPADAQARRLARVTKAWIDAEAESSDAGGHGAAHLAAIFLAMFDAAVADDEEDE